MRQSVWSKEVLFFASLFNVKVIDPARDEGHLPTLDRPTPDSDVLCHQHRQANHELSRQSLCSRKGQHDLCIVSAF